MIFLRICSKDKKQINRVAEILLKEKLALDLNVKSNVERLELQNNQLVKKKILMLTAKTKSLLFTSIQQRLNEEFKGDTMPEFYSTPIVNMDWQQAEHLSEVLRQV